MFELCSSHRQRETYIQGERRRGRERGVRHMRVVTPNKNARCPRPARGSRVPLSFSFSLVLSLLCSSTVNNNNNSTRAARGCSGSLQNTESGVLPNCIAATSPALSPTLSSLSLSSFALTTANRNHLFRATLARAYRSLLPLSRKGYVTDTNEGDWVSGEEREGKGSCSWDARVEDCVTPRVFFRDRSARDCYIRNT